MLYIFVTKYKEKYPLTDDLIKFGKFGKLNITNITDMLTQYGNMVQYDQVAGPLHCLYLFTILNKHKNISLSMWDPGTAT